MDDTTSQPAGNTRGISLIGLIALVISSSIGSGVFALSTDISAAAAPGPALIAWLITGIACYIWARVEQRQKVFTARERLLAFLLVAIGIFMIGYVAANGIL